MMEYHIPLRTLFFFAAPLMDSRMKSPKLNYTVLKRGSSMIISRPVREDAFNHHCNTNIIVDTAMQRRAFECHADHRRIQRPFVRGSALSHFGTGQSLLLSATSFKSVPKRQPLVVPVALFYSITVISIAQEARRIKEVQFWRDRKALHAEALCWCTTGIRITISRMADNNITHNLKPG